MNRSIPEYGNGPVGTTTTGAEALDESCSQCAQLAEAKEAIRTLREVCDMLANPSKHGFAFDGEVMMIVPEKARAALAATQQWEEP